ncbi:conjugal transfer protein TrbJ [Caulobacter sp. S45]|uniref:conjugal transfer protein TrbJ n=1 Tax=Caulobacter sp. S45 TaxID=1641861 RepID=UPI00131D675D|nr:conjugal transfer protein TrbJ [Caulobacter sp. S45]
MTRLTHVRRLTALSLTLALIAAPNAHAQLTVYDPATYGQMLSQVSNSLKQISQMETQITQAESMLASIPGDVTGPFLQIRNQALQIMQQAQGLGYQTANLASGFNTAYPTSMTGQSATQINAALADWQARTRQTLQDAMAMQNQVVAGQATTSSAVSSAVTLSQAAGGQTAAVQATNQLLATVSTQLTQLQNLLMTTARAAQTAQAEQQAQTAAAQAESTRALTYTAPASRITNAGHL